MFSNKEVEKFLIEIRHELAPLRLISEVLKDDKSISKDNIELLEKINQGVSSVLTKVSQKIISEESKRGN